MNVPGVWILQIQNIFSDLSNKRSASFKNPDWDFLKETNLLKLLMFESC